MGTQQEIDSIVELIEHIHQTQEKLEKISSQLDDKASELIIILNELQSQELDNNQEDNE